MTLKIGMLVPNSNFVDHLAKDMIAAFELGLGHEDGLAYELFIEPAGYLVDVTELSEKIQSLLIKDGVDLIVSPLNVGLFEKVEGYFSSNQVPLIVNSLGADVIFNSAQAPYLFINSFNLWKSCWMTGFWGARNFGHGACSMSAFHEGGYGMGFAFAVGLEASNGELLQAAVTHRDSRTEDPSEEIRRVADNDPAFILGLYSGKESVSFLQAYDGLELFGKIPLMGLPVMVPEQFRKAVGKGVLGLRSISCWDRDTDENRQFEKALGDCTGHEANPYTLLTYESGLLINRALEILGKDKAISDQLPKALKAAQIEGPRGHLKFDAETRETETRDYLLEIGTDDNGKYVWKTVKQLTAPPLFFEQLSLARKNLTKQGWLNPYLVA